ncbi:unnamed protein product [Allacma fusca]|uniref:Vitellogenin n=1 Tax=Allacma fusca TaxID=39272 RepID=A0A8J2MD38_9HEXA|nr:unnamed protein product [Allacma fusca]
MKTSSVAVTLLFLWLGVGTQGERVMFTPGQEYTYSYETLVTTGTEEPTGYASAYKLNGVLRVQAENSNTVNVQLDDLNIGLYNGPWTYFPMPSFQTSSAADLSSLSEPFQIQTENGKFKILVMNDQEPEWASNLKRGIATYLQMDMSLAEFDKVGLHRVPESTTMGECSTKYEVIPPAASKTGLTTISKFRNHADCSDVPTRTKFPTRIFNACPDQRTKNALNSTAYATYVVDAASSPDALTVHHITVFSSVLYWPFTVSSPYMYTWLNLTIHLNNVGPVVNPIAGIENPENHEDLSFVFEQNDLNDPEDEIQDFKSADPMLFHHTAGESDPEVLQGIMEQLHQTTKEVAESILTTDSLLGDDLDKFHKNSLFAIIPLISSLDYESLKHCYQKYLEAHVTQGQQATIEFQLFLDGLIATGTWPSSLTIRDILVSTTDPIIIARLAPSFPHYIINPTEALANELEPIFDLTKKASIMKPIRRILQLSMATLISKACQKSLCTQTGLLSKYITYFEGKLANKESFEIQTLGVHGLRNLAVGKSLDKLLEIVTGPTDVSLSVRVQAIWSLRPLAFEEDSKLFEKLLPVFYNRSEPCEIRTSIFSFLMSCNPDKRVLHEISYFMWTETCPQTANLVRATLLNLAKSTNPCAGESKYYAQTILKYLPPGAIDPTRTTTYAINYYDEEHGFGQETVVALQKGGSTSLPISVYLGQNTYIGGYAASHRGIYIRLEGLGKAIGRKLAALRNADVEEIKNILGKIDVKTRPTTPLKLEVAVLYHGKTVLYFAADERTIDTLPQLLHRLGEIKSSSALNLQKSILEGGALYQQPMEIGVPIVVTSALTYTVAIAMNDTRAKQEGLLTQDTTFKLQLNTFGVTRVANHFPGIDAAFGVTSKRTLRINAPRQILVGVDIKNQALIVDVKPPLETDPLIVIGHATTETTLTSDTVHQGPGKVSKAQALLKQSCPSCPTIAVVSKGKASRKTRQRILTSQLITGVKSTVNYFDCERDYTKGTVIGKLAHILNPANKNAGIFGSPITKAILTAQQFRDAIFYSPSTETCGISLSLSQDTSKGHPLETIEGKLTGTVEPSTATNPNFKLSLELTVDLKYSTEPSLKLDSYVSVLYSQLDNQELDIKSILRRNNGQKSGIVCLNIKQTTLFHPKDELCYQGENKPQMKETATLTIGRLPSNGYQGKDTACQSSHLEVLVTAEAHQSEEQILESKQELPPYKTCRDQKSSPLYPGKFVPPTAECYAAALEQTTLRAVNVSINYKLNSIIKKKLRRPLALVEGLLLPFAVDEDEAVDHSHENHVHPPEGQMEEGELELDLNMRRSNPTLDIHYHSSGKEQHFHGVDLNLIPEALRPRPIPSRFSPLIVLGLQLGAFGICSVTPAVVATFDGVVIPGALPNCPTLVSGDCGEMPQYAVLARRRSNSTLAVTIYLGSNLIELEGETMKLNGQTKTLENKIPQDLPVLSANSFNALKNNEEIHIISRFMGIYVRYTGNFVTVSLGSRYRGSQCGLCGKWDSTPANDFLGPDPQCGRILNPSQRAASWVVRDGQCSTVGQACPV